MIRCLLLPRTACFVCLLALSLLLLNSPRCAAAPNPVVVGDARFTVITPLCIRIEQASNGKFIDQKSLFAVNREARFDGFQLTHKGGATIIDTGTIRLTYTPDSKPLSAANLHADIKGGSHWTPGAPNPGNLGGTIRTLDGARGPENLGEGLISRDGWFLLDDSRRPLLTSDWVESRPMDAGTDWYLFGYGNDYKGALKSLTTISGPVPLPRKYALGSWYSRYWPYSSADYREIVKEYAQNDFPLDNMVMDMDWHKEGAWTGWSWNRKLLPDAEDLLKWFHQQGLHDTLNMHPADGVGPQEDRYAQFMRDMGEDPATKKTIPFDVGSKKYMDTLFKDIIDPLDAEGVDFWWLDWQQSEYTRSIPELTNLFWLNTLLYNHSLENGQRGMSFSRWAGWGDQRHPIHFSGDANTGFPMLAFEVPFTATAGNVGCFFWSHDIGGHMGGRNEESYARWVQFGATSPVLRVHSTRDADMDRRPWLYPKWATDSMRISYHMRDALFPYIYSSAWETTQNSIPLDRPLYIDYPKSEQAYHNAQEYLYGDNLLAAPIVTPGVGPGHVSHQTVWFPQGDWYNYFTGEHYASKGDANVLVSADINEFPLYVKGGVPIPMQPYAPRMASVPLQSLVVRCYPGPDGKKGEFTLYEDDGVTRDYQQGAFATTPLSYLRHGDKITVTVGPTNGSYAGQVTQRDIVVELPDTAQGAKASVDGKAVSVSYDAATSTSRIALPTRSVTTGVTVQVTAAPADSAAIADAAMMRRVGGLLDSFSFHGNATPKNVLAAALEQATDPAQRNELLAAAGIGMVPHNTAPYLYHGIIRDEFYAPRGLLDGDKVTLDSGKTVTVSDAGPIDVSGPVITRRGRTITTPGRVKFSIAGHAIELPSAASPEDDLLGPDNVAANAKLTVSGTEDGYSDDGALDGIVSGYPNDKSAEWSSGTTTGATLRLDWTTPQSVDRIVLYDRPNTTDQVTSGTITFSDGSTLAVGPLPDDAKTGLTLKFPAKTITWLIFKVAGVKAGTENSGLAEIGVFRAGAR